MRASELRLSRLPYPLESRPNGGLCDVCGYQNEATFGTILCKQCGSDVEPILHPTQELEPHRNVPTRGDIRLPIIFGVFLVLAFILFFSVF